MHIVFHLTRKSASEIFRAFVALEFLLVGLYVFTTSFQAHIRLRHIFDLDREGNISSWFSSSQLLLAGIVFLIVSRAPAARAIYSPAFFLLFGLSFVFLSMDEAAGIHEMLSAVLQRVEFLPRFADGHGIWIALYAVAGVAVALITFRSMKTFLQNCRSEFLLLVGGLALFIAGGVGLEILSYSIARDGTNFQLHRAQVAFEELLEMFGVSLVLYSALLTANRFMQDSLPQDVPVTSLPIRGTNDDQMESRITN